MVLAGMPSFVWPFFAICNTLDFIPVHKFLNVTQSTWCLLPWRLVMLIFPACYQRCKKKVWSCFVYLLKVPFVFMQHRAWFCCWCGRSLFMSLCQRCLDHARLQASRSYIMSGCICCMLSFFPLGLPAAYCYSCMAAYLGGSNGQLDKMWSRMFCLSGVFTGSTELLLLTCMETLRVQHFHTSAMARKGRALLNLFIT